MARTRPRHPLVPLPSWRRLAARLRRSLALRWAAVAVAAGVVVLEARAVGEAADASRASWGTAREVVVAARDLEVGHVVSAGDVELVERPAAVVPEGALRSSPIGRAVVADIVEGEVVVEARVAPTGLDGAAALVPDGWLALAVAAGGSFGAPAPPLAVGDRVDVLGPDVVVEAAVVVAVDDAAVTVAVPAAEAPDVAAAAGFGPVTLALRGAG